MTNKLIALILALLAVGYGAYSLFTQPAIKLDTVTVPIGVSILDTLHQLENTKIDNSIFTTGTWTALQSFSVLVSEPIGVSGPGRSNPFEHFVQTGRATDAGNKANTASAGQRARTRK